jgi:hypothetical protein
MCQSTIGFVLWRIENEKDARYTLEKTNGQGNGAFGRTLYALSFLFPGEKR